MNLLDLPLEIREAIYRPILDPSNYRQTDQENYTRYNYRPALSSLLRINRQIYKESWRIFLDQNAFVSIETPWEQAQHHVASEGHVPILISGTKADNFVDHTLNVSITAPDYAFAETGMVRFVIHADDLPRFTESWRYSDLSHMSLNQHLALTLTLRDPKIRKETWKEPYISKAMQSRLLLPFGMIKNLHSMHVKGSPEPLQSLVKQLREEQAKPHPSPESCLREAARLKEAGNALLAKGQYEETLELYRQAWLAMHIVVNGRSRHVHADEWYARILEEDEFKGLQGPTARLRLRVTLVANTVQVYLKMEQYEEAHYWGMRTIGMMRQAIGLPADQEAPRAEDEAILNFIAASQLGKIYYRTALSSKALGDLSEARKLLKVAHVYLPNDPFVTSEIGKCALRLG